MEIRIVTDNEFDQLCNLTVAMYKSIDPSITAYGAINTLLYFTTQENFICVGLFENNKLIGFTFGHKFKTKCFLFSGIYVIIKNNRHLKKLIGFSFAYIKDLGYTSWVVDATNDNIGSIMQKYNAISKFVRYEGDL